MAIPVITIPLDKMYKLSANQQDPELIKNWHERIILPEVLSTLELYLMRKGIKNIHSLSDACNALADPLSALAFSPVNHQHRHLAPVEVHQHINVVCALETDVLDEAHCALGVCFVGTAAQQLEALLQNVWSPFGHKHCSHMSTKSM